MSETKEIPQKIDQAAYQEVYIERKLKFREFYPVNGLFDYVRISIERKTGKLWCLTSARLSPAWVRLDATRIYQLDGRSASRSSEVLVLCAQSLVPSTKKQPRRRRPNELGQADS